jgi:hypothetical protein
MGQCHAFAVALHKATDWPIVVFPNGGGHVVVEHPSGRYVDITGWVDEDELTGYYGGYHRYATPEELEDESSDGTWYPLHVEEASTFVAPLLDTIAEHRKA